MAHINESGPALPKESLHHSPALQGALYMKGTQRCEMLATHASDQCIRLLLRAKPGLAPRRLVMVFRCLYRRPWVTLNYVHMTCGQPKQCNTCP
ncbi:hypothetical protein ALQ94_200157 [Pseudomonas amygdali pv. morsprunorum]|uniref:Uncharacterized protein n=1 Tax=Pseudomonas amygdali pv. morsprunorum TaxID=129138 RepID=A0A3M2X123_PSEA0|nr:hypothetical protein ALQ94_200157 [Pseudomonas amygdali pv. morsprunorum]